MLGTDCDGIVGCRHWRVVLRPMIHEFIDSVMALDFGQDAFRTLA
jgi:hypothetical protein